MNRFEFDMSIILFVEVCCVDCLMPTGLIPIHHHDHGPDQGQGTPIPLPDQGHAPGLIQGQGLEVEGKC